MVCNGRGKLHLANLVPAINDPVVLPLCSFPTTPGFRGWVGGENFQGTNAYAKEACHLDPKVATSHNSKARTKASEVRANAEHMDSETIRAHGLCDQERNTRTAKFVPGNKDRSSYTFCGRTTNFSCPSIKPLERESSKARTTRHGMQWARKAALGQPCSCHK